MARRLRRPRVRKAKKVSYELIPRESRLDLYQLLNELVTEHHSELRRARIALAWNLTWKPDVDGRVKLGQCRRVGELDREIGECDFIIILRKEFWQSSEVTDRQRRALLDHELCHASVSYDTDGEPKVDERGKVCYRTRRHDLEEFACIASRYGTWKKDLETFDIALRRGKQQTLPNLEKAG